MLRSREPSHVLRAALAVLWLLDGALQLQPFMFTTAFAHQVLRGAADGQPTLVSAPVHVMANLVASHPIVWNALFAGTQLAIGAALLVPRWARPALLASAGWALGVWAVGEGFGGLLSGHAMLLTGAPGAALLYAVLSAAAWPNLTPRARERILLTSWVGVWTLGVLLQALPGQNTDGQLSAALRTSSASAPRWLQHLTRLLAHHLPAGSSVVLALILLQLLTALLLLQPGWARHVAIATGVVLTGSFWTFGQGLGQLSTGQGTDPQTGPLLLLLTLGTVLAGTRIPRSPARLRPADSLPAGPVLADPWRRPAARIRIVPGR